MEIINTLFEDYHIHSFNYSDGMSTVDEIVKFSSKIGLKEIGITDHCQVHLDVRKLMKKNHYDMITRWNNVHNDVTVRFGVEADILSENGDVCMDIQNYTPEIIILSSHPEPVYHGDPKKITQAYLNAIDRYHKKISFLGHLCSTYFEREIQIKPIIDLCNYYNLPIEFNCANFVNKRTNLKNLNEMLKNINRIYVNSDAHTLYEIKEYRKIGFQYLADKGYIN